MVNSYHLTKNNIVYYDLERKTIARCPTKSNLFVNGSDNSLYFGMITNPIVSDVFCKLFDEKSLTHINGKNFDMRCVGETVNIICNVNAQGQVQLKLSKNGILHRLTSEYAFDEMQNFDFTKMLVVVDFIKKEIRFKRVEELSL